MTDVRNGKMAVGRIRSNLLPGIIAAIKTRIESFQEEIYGSIASIADHNLWNFEDSQYGIKEIQTIYEHFKKPLDENNFNEDLAMYEYREVKRIVKTRYRHLTSIAVWESIMSKHSNLRNIILISELILCIEWSSSTVERGFSTTGRLLTPYRKSLTKVRLDNLLMLRVNIPVLKSLDPNYEENRISKAVASYIPGRYHKTKSKTSSAIKLMYACF